MSRPHSGRRALYLLPRCSRNVDDGQGWPVAELRGRRCWPCPACSPSRTATRYVASAGRDRSRPSSTSSCAIEASTEPERLSADEAEQVRLRARSDRHSQDGQGRVSRLAGYLPSRLVDEVARRLQGDPAELLGGGDEYRVRERAHELLDPAPYRGRDDENLCSRVEP